MSGNLRFFEAFAVAYVSRCAAYKITRMESEGGDRFDVWYQPPQVEGAWPEPLRITFFKSLAHAIEGCELHAELVAATNQGYIGEPQSATFRYAMSEAVRLLNVPGYPIDNIRKALQNTGMLPRPLESSSAGGAPTASQNAGDAH